MKAPISIPGYELIKRIGGGLLTTVHSAREVATDTPCAVKILRPDWDDQSTAALLLKREALAGLKVQHPYVVPFRHAHVLTPPYFVVMDLLPGESLRQRLRRDYKLQVAEAIWIGRQAAEGLAALHQAGFVHGDIKPDNVLLSCDKRAILIDLGFAHRPGENAALMQEGYILGTIDYLAPELCSCEPGNDSVGADLFSLGVTLFEMLTGRMPYPKGSVDQTIRRHECDPPADIRRYEPGLPPALVKLVSKLMSRRPADRPAASTVVQQLVALEIATLQMQLVA